MPIKSNNDYLKLGKRYDAHLTIRDDLYTEVSILSARWKQPIGKIMDVLLIDLLADKDIQNNIHHKVRNYR